MDPVGLLGLGFVLVLWMTFTTSGNRAAKSFADNYRARNRAWQKQHPNTVALARFAGPASAFVHGIGPALKAFQHDWTRDWNESRDRVRARYPRLVDEPKPAETTDNPPPAVAKPKPVPPGLRLVKNDPPIPTKKGSSDMAADNAEINNFASLRAYLEDNVRMAQAVAEDAADAVNRAAKMVGRSQYAADAAPGILNRHPEAAGKVAGLVDPWQKRLEAERARQNMMDQALAQAKAALADVNQHRAMEEAVAATPKASTDTRVYQPQ